MFAPMRRVVLIAFFLGFNFVLGSYFLSQYSFPLPAFAHQFLSYFEVLPAVTTPASNRSIVNKDPNLSAGGVMTETNLLRQGEDLEKLASNMALTQAAQLMLEEYQAKKFDLKKIDPQALERSLKKAGYKYELVGNNVLIGPLFNEEVIKALKADDDQLGTVINEEYSEVGIATSIVTIYNTQIGLTVQLLGKPIEEEEVIASKPAAVISSTTRSSVQGVSEDLEMSDREVLEALNVYRASHGLYALNEDQNLCKYAEKRVQDLIAFGGLDNHAGFRADFEDLNSIPASIKAYGGSQVAENLANQFCKNMTTGDSFVADTGTALIEWCFDSSTKGHREAQLSQEYTDVCIRHGENMYAVVFGN